MKKEIEILIKLQKSEFDTYYKNLLKKILPINELSDVIIYSAMNGGKRIRPFLIQTFANLANIKKQNYMMLSSAVESIHTYSLIHDDLPSMDNDDFRRGKLTAHKKFGEAQAILAGDSLHDIAFELLSDIKTIKNSNIRIELIKKLSVSLGSKGLAGGQSLDLIYENKKANKKEIIDMYHMKTSALFCFCCEAPFIMANKNKEEISFAYNYGKLFGLIFQIIDDYLDEFGNYKLIGKTLGKDKKVGKKTILKHINTNSAKEYCEKIFINFKNKNDKYFSKWNILEKLIYHIIKRKN